MSHALGMPLKHIYGDSYVIINWENNRADLSSIELSHWCEYTKLLILGFDGLNISHVYREHNQRADSFSKDTLVLAPGLCIFSKFEDDSICMSGSLRLF